MVTKYWGEYAFYYLTVCDKCSFLLEEALKDTNISPVYFNRGKCDIQSRVTHQGKNIQKIDALWSKFGRDQRIDNSFDNLSQWKFTNSARLQILRTIAPSRYKKKEL